MPALKEKIGIIGVGRLGFQLAIMLKEVDYKISVVIDTNTYKAIKCMNECNAQVSSDSLSDIGNDVTILFICVQDHIISSIAHELAKNKNLNKNLVIAHTSGLYTSDILHVIRQDSIHLCSFHPCYSFTEGDNYLPEDIYYAIEGDDEGYTRLGKVAESLGGKSFRINKDEQAVYHTACSMASNFLVGLMKIVERFLRENRSQEESAFLWPLVQGTLENIKSKGINEALTGPITRGDVETIEKHLLRLKKYDKSIVDLYIFMGRQLLQIVKEKGMAKTQIKSIEKIFKKYSSGTL